MTRGSTALQSLSVRLLVPLVGLLAIAFGVHAALSLQAAETRLSALAEDEASRSAALVLRATHDRMLEGGQRDVQRAIDALIAEETVTSVRIYTPDGAIAQSGSGEEVGSRVDRREAPCGHCHRAAAAKGGSLPRELAVWGTRSPTMHYLSVIPNQERCGECHPPADRQPILGVLDVELSMAPVQEALSSARRRTLWTMSILLLFTGVLSTGLVRHLVDRPIRRLFHGTERIARGDLDTRIEVKGRDELAALAVSFNHMAAEVQAAREEVTQWSRRLESQIVEKTEALRQSQRQVLQTERMASLGKLAATVAHELNNPLSGILSCAKVVERELDSQQLPPDLAREIGEYLRLIEQECSRCGSIVQNLLLFARHAADTEMGAVDVRQVVERSLLLVRHRLEVGDIELRAALGEETGIVGNAGELEQAVVALLVNALEAMEAGGDGGILDVRVTGEPDAVSVEVGDTGVGVHPDVLPHIFEPFFSTKHQESGVGLGLAVVYGIVQRHGGTIEVRSEPGSGTTFTLRLPRRPERAGRDRTDERGR